MLPFLKTINESIKLWAGLKAVRIVSKIDCKKQASKVRKTLKRVTKFSI